jgi:formylglycine-generating enzyme required for sulfatase activity
VVIPSKDVPGSPIPKRPAPVKPTPAPKARFKTETAVALIGAMTTLCAALLGVLPYLQDWILPQTPEVSIILSLTSAGNAALVPAATTSMPETDFTFTPTLPVTEAVILTDTLISSEVATITSTATITATETVVPTLPLIQTTILPTDILPATTPEAAGIDMVPVPEGDFIMGYKGNSDAPRHTVPLGSFYIDKYEVTNVLYKACVDVNACPRPSNQTAYNDPLYAEYPVVFVDWKQAKTYCEWRGARLPTEAEWEKAARGTQERNYPWGDGIDCTFANFSGCKDKDGTSQVGSYEAGKSMYDAYDLAGNVSEWVSSLFKPYPYGAFDGREDPDAPGNRVLRGGNWNLEKNLLFSWYRNEADPKQPLDRVGFRCARDMDG